ncbi:MAG: hypothetical protein GY815_04190 [Gammaproteobacteria bacterium]|nr:hypothetical protein [Gammaproteobacteria bacterium]
MAQSKFYDAQHSPNQLKADAAMHGFKDIERGTNSKESDKQPHNDDYWLMIARDAFNESENYYDSNVRKEHERNLAHFQSRHAPGSKYYKDAYKYRHKSFRPKTRSMVRRQESALMKSMFSTSDFVTVKAARSHHPSHRVSGDINQKLLQYRLENTIPWATTVIGAYQETLNLGIVISHQAWKYEEEGEPDFFDEIDYTDTDPTRGTDPGEGYTPPKDQQEELIKGDETGGQDSAMTAQQESTALTSVIETEFETKNEIVHDTPDVELRPCENVRFSVAADWRDPANTSPFIVDQIPMYIDDVKRKARDGKWYPLTEAQLLVGVTADYSSVRSQRESQREDSKDERHLHRGFDTVWVHRNIIKKNGIDWIYYTLGVHYRLSEPVPLRQDPDYKWLRPGERPYIIGYANIEAHKNYPESIVGLAAGTQQDANVLNNTRFDNVELSLNRRYIVKRGAMIDYRGLQRNVPGGVTETDDPNNDVRLEAPPDVTASAYQEQDRINADFDELVGMFSGSSVGSNRQMNETVGGMKLLAGDADALTEYPMMIFMITWVIPVLKQLIRLEQHYESDGAILNLIGEDLQLWQKYGIDRVTDKWIQGSMNIQVAANFGAANPEQRIQRLAMGFGIILQMAPALAQRLDGTELAKEIMGALGYQGTERFFPSQQPDVPGTTPPQDNTGEVTEQDQAKLDQEQGQHQQKMDMDERRLAFEELKHSDNMLSKDLERRLKGEITDKQLMETLERLKVDRQNKVDEMKIKLRNGTGI